MERRTEPGNRRPAGSAVIAARLVEAVDLEVVVAAAVDAIWEQVPGYRLNQHPTLRQDAIRLNTEVQRKILACIAEGRPVQPSDIPTTRKHASKRVEQGISLADFLHAYRVAQLTVWDAIIAAADRDGDPDARDAALGIARQVMHAIEVCSTVAAEAYLDAEAHRLADSDRTRRDLLEYLLAGSEVPPGSKQAYLHATGLEHATGVVVVTAVPVNRTDPERALREVARALTRLSSRGPQGIAVVRQDEVVAILPVARSGPSALLDAWADEVARLRERQVLLAVGVSTVHATLGGVPEAYAEACVARKSLRGEPGILALPLLSVFEYLTLRDEPTAARAEWSKRSATVHVGASDGRCVPTISAGPPECLAAPP